MDSFLLELLPKLVLLSIPILILIVLIPLETKEFKKKKERNKINKLFYKDLEIVNSNDFHNAFNQIYGDSTKVVLENRRKKLLMPKYILITFIFICIFSMLYNMILFNSVDIEIIILKILIEAIVLSVLVYALKKINLEYETFYKKLIFKPVIELLYSGFTYTVGKASKLELEYMKLDYDNRYIVSTETHDYLKGRVGKNTLIEITDLKAYVSHYKQLDETLFKGLFANINCEKNIGETKILITHNTCNKKREKYKVQLDNIQFENNFTVFSENKELARKVLTQEVIQMILAFYNNHHIIFDITITNDQIYFRFFTNHIFDTDIFEKEVNKHPILLYCYIIDFILEFTRKFN